MVARRLYIVVPRRTHIPIVSCYSMELKYIKNFIFVPKELEFFLIFFEIKVVLYYCFVWLSTVYSVRRYCCTEFSLLIMFAVMPQVHIYAPIAFSIRYY